MKKVHFVLIGLSVMSAVTILFINPIKATSQKKIPQTITSSIIPEDVAAVLRTSCVSCHDAGGNSMAMMNWSFSSWDKYSTDKQSKLAIAICNAITNGSMPPSWVRQSNPDRMPNEDQTAIICNWAGTPNFSIPEDVAGVLGKSCISCHSEGGNEMAMMHWNFSTWDKYSEKKQISLAKAICNAMTKGSMPPSWVKQINPDRIPTAIETEMVCKWAGSREIK